MDFRQRFKGKMTAIGKSGVTPIIQSPSLPIIKQYHLSPSVSPIMKFPEFKETKSLVFTNIRNANQFKKTIKQKLITDEELHLDFSKYQIVAIPKIYSSRHASPISEFYKKYQYF